jgi:uncharacterized membrane protein YfcA
MSVFEYIALAVVFFVTSMVGVVTGSNSLITVPMMMQFDIDPRVAVATNMFGLTFMSIGASIPFIRNGSVEKKRLPRLIVLTLAGSGLGALLVGMISGEAMRAVVAASMLFVIGFILLRPGGGHEGETSKGSILAVAAYAISFVLAVYGGLYSGGYVTMLTACFVAFLGMSFTEAVATTKVVNVFSSSVATLVFIWQGLVDWTLGAILAVTMFTAAYIGAHTVTKLSDVWLKRIFISFAMALALKTLVDFAIG